MSLPDSLFLGISKSCNCAASSENDPVISLVNTAISRIGCSEVVISVFAVNNVRISSFLDKRFFIAVYQNLAGNSVGTFFRCVKLGNLFIFPLNSELIYAAV